MSFLFVQLFLLTSRRNSERNMTRPLKFELLKAAYCSRRRHPLSAEGMGRNGSLPQDARSTVGLKKSFIELHKWCTRPAISECISLGDCAASFRRLILLAKWAKILARKDIRTDYVAPQKNQKVTAYAVLLLSPCRGTGAGRVVGFGLHVLERRLRPACTKEHF